MGGASGTEAEKDIAVLLAVRNGEGKLARTLESLARQTLSGEHFKICVLDDGSTDATPRLLAEAAARGELTVIGRNEPALGLTKSLNVLLNKTRSRYVARVDCGDTCAPERLAHQLAYLETHPDCAAVCSSAELFVAPDQRVGPAFEPLQDELTVRHFRLKNPVHHGSVMLRREPLERLGGYNESRRFAQDLDLWLRLLGAGHRMHWLKEPLYALEVDPAGISGTHAEEQARLADDIRQPFFEGDQPSKRRMNAARMIRLARLRALPVVGAAFRAAESALYEVRCALG